MSEFNNYNYNITFCLKEKNDDKNNEDEIQKMMYEFNEEIETDEFKSEWFQTGEAETEYLLHKSKFENNKLFYEKEYTVKDLIKICSYYGLDKDIRTSKYKKQDIIATLVYFESLHENFEIVQKRNKMWAYIRELLHDPKMKNFVIWN